MSHLSVFETFQTVPVASLSDMSPYQQAEEKSGQAFPIPGEEFTFMRLDLSRAIIRNPAQTFFILLTERRMEEAGYLAGDILIVDRQATPRHRDLIVAYLEGEFTMRRLIIVEGMPLLESDEGMMPVDPDMSFSVWGVVKDVIHS